MARKTDKQLLDEALAGGTTIDEILAGADKTLAKANTFSSRISGEVDAQQAQRNAERESTLGGQLKAHPLDAVKRGVMGAAYPLSFASGPVGVAASVPLSIQALSDFAQDPSVMNAVMAGAMTLPLAKAVRGLKGTAVAGDMFPRATAGARWAMGKETPISSGVQQAASAVRPSMAALVPDAPIAERGVRAVAKKQLAEFERAQMLKREMRPPASVERPEVDKALSSHGASNQFNGRTYDTTFASDAQNAASQSKARGMRNWAAAKASAARPAADFVHPADTSGAQFGFPQLPELSESELSRMQALFKRVGAGR